jgi:D-alanyl-D-alanine carboxypeptidase
MRRTAILGLVGAALAVAASPAQATAAQTPELPAAMRAIMEKPRYATARWSLLVADVRTGETVYALDPDQMSFTGSTRKLFSVGLALDALGVRGRQVTPVHRRGRVDAQGVLRGDLVLVGGGDLAFGGRRLGRDEIQYTNFDHNDANGLGTAILTPQDPLFALNELARAVRASGIRSVAGEVAVDDRLFEPYRVPNGNLLITPVMVNENMVDVTVEPTTPGRPAKVSHRPATAAFDVAARVITAPAGAAAFVSLSGRGLIECIGTPGCRGRVGAPSHAAIGRRSRACARSSGRSASRIRPPSRARRSSRRCAAMASRCGRMPSLRTRAACCRAASATQRPRASRPTARRRTRRLRGSC